ncbi:hypothetical protein Clacol_008666 [Clathrus columnatus]|uniref:Uncharacterized protein n=1 Tax=Clathrus columnatus TaxID=1419009 RepID=A0AAV5AIC3_9AGAM|nr:hypothetical protein Clacol_008666 [Clathrus columnatus]
MPSFPPFDGASSFFELLVYTTGAASAGVNGYTVEILNNFSIGISSTNAVLGIPVQLSSAQAFANDMLFGPTDVVQGFLPPLFTPIETKRAFIPFAGNCSLGPLDPTDQSAAFDTVPPVVFVSDSGQPSSPPFVTPANTTLNIDTTLLRDSDNCKPDAPGLSCQIMALQDVNSFQAVSVAVQPLNECQVTVPGVNVIYITSNDTPLPTDPADRVTMPIDTICAGLTYVYVHDTIASQV